MSAGWGDSLFTSGARTPHRKQDMVSTQPLLDPQWPPGTLRPTWRVGSPHKELAALSLIPSPEVKAQMVAGRHAPLPPAILRGWVHASRLQG